MTVDFSTHRGDAAATATVNEASTFTVRGRTIRATGALDGCAVELLLGAVLRLLAVGGSHVTLDLTAVTGIDSDAVRGLFAAQRDAGPAGVVHLIVADRLRPRLAVCRLAAPMLVADHRPPVLAEAS